MTSILKALVAIALACMIVGGDSYAADAPVTSQPSATSIKIVLTGDSTVTDKSGWGVGFKDLLAPNVTCVNLAQGGRSSKSYRDEGWWDKAMAEKGDYVLIQFGHNDQPGKGPERETDPKTTFAANLKRYVEETRAAGAKPILLTSLTRRNFNADGTIRRSLDGYVDATRAVAAETNTPLIELHDKSLALAEKLGPKGCEALSPIGKDGKVDTTHLNTEGSKVFGAIIVEELIRVLPELAPHFKKPPTQASATIPPDITVAADGSGQFKTIQEAVASIPKDNRERTIVLIKDGVYNEKVRIDAACVTLRGQSRAGTRIEFSQLNDDFTKNPDDLGRAVVNVKGDNFVLENLTVRNTAGIVGPHSFAVYGTGDRTVIVDCDVLSEGADTVSLWRGKDGRYYHARCNFRGAVDFVCPRGWCFIRDSAFFETKNTAAIWHDGRHDKDMKFVLRNCTFDGVEGWNLARHHHDAAFYLLDCTFSKSMIDRAPFRVIYPLGGKEPTEADISKNKELEKTNLWGERSYFHNCHREGGDDFAWHADNLSTAEGSPKPEQITPAWTFAGKWDPERTDGPKIRDISLRDGKVEVTFDERVTVKGKPRLKLRGGKFGDYVSGSGSETLLFDASDTNAATIDLNGGAIIASEAAATIRAARLSR